MRRGQAGAFQPSAWKTSRKVCSVVVVVDFLKTGCRSAFDNSYLELKNQYPNIIMKRGAYYNLAMTFLPSVSSYMGGSLYV